LGEAVRERELQNVIFYEIKCHLYLKVTFLNSEKDICQVSYNQDQERERETDKIEKDFAGETEGDIYIYSLDIVKVKAKVNYK
jgi:hypothetical protein